MVISYISAVWNAVVAESNITTVNDLCMTSASSLKVKYCCSSEALFAVKLKIKLKSELLLINAIISVCSDRFNLYPQK